ncbi:MAG TPA: hypothetical protein VK578_24025 [Edaphobacter sp.]|nr:hypothetical protein [Edaphobacter sp.]
MAPPLTQAANLINQAVAALGYAGLTPAELYSNVDNIVQYLNTEVHAIAPIAVGTTGAILETLCRYGLDAAVEGTPATVSRMPQQWKWVGDFSIPGDPFNLVISCKSFKAKERLLASGSGSALSPTIGWGAFNDPREFNSARLASYAYRGFVAIYMPEATRNALTEQALAFTNINGRPFIRPHLAMIADIQAALNVHGRINPRLL